MYEQLFYMVYICVCLKRHCCFVRYSYGTAFFLVLPAALLLPRLSVCMHGI